MNTNHLIEHLVAQALPVKRLASPLKRTAQWIAFALMINGVIIAYFGLRPDVMEALSTPNAMTEWVASVLTGVLAAYAVFQISVPGRGLRWAWLPLPMALLWIAGMGLGCWYDLDRSGEQAFALTTGGRDCTLAITLTASPLGLTMLFLVRHAKVVQPKLTAMLVALSVAALSSAGLSLYHAGETAFMVLVWHAGAVAALSVMSWAFGRQLFSWISPDPRSD